VAECGWCLLGLPVEQDHHRLQSLTELRTVEVRCARGPIERELRAVDWSTTRLDTTTMSVAAQTVMRGTSMYADEDADWTWADVGSEAIEAAAELRL
jgi:hypothetical protein